MKKKKQDKKVKKVFLIIYIVLIILIVVLGCKLYKLNKNNKNTQKANIVVPLFGNDSIGFNIFVKDLKKNKSINYYIRVTNYRDKKISKKNINYNIKLLGNNNLKLKLYKENSKNNLLDSDNSVKGLKLKGKRKDEVLYKVSIYSKEKIKNGIIKVEIDS